MQKGGLLHEREEALMQELREEQEAHEATRNELAASEEALEAATAAANGAAEQEEATAIELAALRKQLEKLLEEHARSTVAPWLRL
jgi:hypothetical protein